MFIKLPAPLSMKPFRLLFSIATLALIVLFTLTATITEASTPKPAPAPVDPRILIKSVNAATGTIVIQYMRDKTVRTYTMDDLTVIKINDNPGKMADVKVGMQLTAYVERDAHTLDSASIDNASPGPTPPPKKK